MRSTLAPRTEAAVSIPTELFSRTNSTHSKQENCKAGVTASGGGGTQVAATMVCNCIEIIRRASVIYNRGCWSLITTQAFTLMYTNIETDRNFDTRFTALYVSLVVSYFRCCPASRSAHKFVTMLSCT